MTRFLSVVLSVALAVAMALGVAAPLAEPALGEVATESVRGERQAEKSARRRELEQRQAEQARQRAETRRREEARRTAEERARTQARLRAEDGRRRAAARARIRELEREPSKRKLRYEGRATRPVVSLRTLRRNERAALGIDRVPPAHSFRVHYDAGVCKGYYVTTINRLRYRRGLTDQRPVFDPLRPYSGVVDVPAGVWTNRDR